MGIEVQYCTAWGYNTAPMAAAAALPHLTVQVPPLLCGPRVGEGFAALPIIVAHLHVQRVQQRPLAAVHLGAVPRAEPAHVLLAGARLEDTLVLDGALGRSLPGGDAAGGRCGLGGAAAGFLHGEVVGRGHVARWQQVRGGAKVGGGHGLMGVELSVAQNGRSALEVPLQEYDELGSPTCANMGSL